MNDNEIVTLYFERNEKAISETAKKYGNYCFSISYKILQSLEDAEECVNDTWQSAWGSIPPQRPERLSVYLGKITRNLSLNRLKRYNSAKRGNGQINVALAELEESIPAAGRTETLVEQKQVTAVIERFLSVQPPMKRRIFLRRYWYLESVAEIARFYAISESRVTSILFRMRKELKSGLEKEDIFYEK